MQAGSPTPRSLQRRLQKHAARHASKQACQKPALRGDHRLDAHKELRLHVTAEGLSFGVNRPDATSPHATVRCSSNPYRA
eukprot:scaffold12612_cov36-Tisochrysis_lutea.AAC.2